MKATGASMGYRIPTNPNSGAVSIPAQPVEHFPISPLAPPEVQSADENFRRLSTEYAEVKSQLSEGFKLREHEIGQAHAAAATARVESGKPPAKTSAMVEAEWDAKLVELRSEQWVLADAVDQAGDTLVETIKANRDEWLATLDAADERATVKLDKAVKMVTEALDVLRSARSAPEWLREFSGTPFGGGDLGGDRAVGDLEEIVNGRQRLIGYRDDDGDGTAEPIFEQVGGPSAKQGRS